MSMDEQSNAGRILIISGVRGDTRRYRALHLFEQLQLAGANVVLSHLVDRNLPHLAASASLVIVHRVAMDRYVDRIFRIIRRHGALLVLDADDFLYDASIMRWIDSPDFQDPVRAYLYRQELLRHRATLESCDAVTVSTDYLAGMIKFSGKPIVVHRNAYSMEMRALSDQAVARLSPLTDKVIIGYASGTHTHDRDFAMIQPALCELMERNPRVNLWLMGAVSKDYAWGQLAKRVSTFPLVPWRSLPERLSRLDINLAPLLLESPFNQAKSEIKFMEAALVHVPTIASKSDAFDYAIQSGRNGLLAEGFEDWRSSLSLLVQNEEMRKEMGETAYQDVIVRYAPLEHGQELLHRLSELTSRLGKIPVPVPTRQSSTITSGLLYGFSKSDEVHPTMAELAWYSFRNRGVLTLLGQIWVFFRRKITPIFPFRKSESS